MLRFVFMSRGYVRRAVPMCSCVSWAARVVNVGAARVVGCSFVGCVCILFFLLLGRDAFCIFFVCVDKMSGCAFLSLTSMAHMAAVVDIFLSIFVFELFSRC